jgi:chaperone modulatory protein CbpM
VTAALTRPRALDLDAFARATGLHPELVQRFVILGLIEAYEDSSGRLWFAPNQVAAVARVRRLRAGLALNYAAIGLVAELLDRITVLERELQRERQANRTVAAKTEATPWT